MVEVKVECGCGQRYAFDVEPVEGQVPASIACPACGADGTARANEFIARATEVPAVRSTLSIARPAPGQEQPARVQHAHVPALQPPVNDDLARDLIEAKENVARARNVALIVAGVDLLVGILFLCGVRTEGMSLWILLDVAILGGLAYGIHRFSRACAVTMFLYYLLIVFLNKTGLVHLVIRGVFLYYCGRGVHGTFVYHKLKKLVS